MGLIKAGLGALGGTLADQWKEFFYCDSLPVDVLMKKGQKQIGGRSSNTKGSDNVISNGSGIAVADGQCMIIVEQGKVVEVCAEPGEFTYDTSTEPSIFAGKLGQSILDTFKTIGKRFTMGGDTGKDQRVYYFNTKEIIGNKFGTPSPIIFEVMNKRLGFSRTVNVRCNGMYSYTISNPLLFYTKIAGNVADEYTRDMIDDQLKTEFVSALQPAFGALAEMELRPAQLPAKVNELKAAMNEALQYEWVESRGISVEKIALNPITLNDEDMKTIQEMEDSMSYGSNAAMALGRMASANANAMEIAAGNEAGAMTGFMGMGMAGNAMGGGMNVVQQIAQLQQQQAAAAPAPAAPAAGSWTCACGTVATGKFCPECGAPKPADEGWTCACGTVNKGKFCSECGAKKPAGVPQYKCDKCGWQPEDPTKAPKFCPECGDPFDNGDIV
ncbi:MAG: SPFH domain-containing protein [Clostridia bacterium]|nr:SPFH domain-containing protein [Clostridia bacterium]